MTPGMVREVANLIKGLGLGMRAGLLLYLEVSLVVVGGRQLDDDDDYDYDCYRDDVEDVEGGG